MKNMPAIMGATAAALCLGVKAHAQAEPSAYEERRASYFEALSTLGEIGLLRYYGGDVEFGEVNSRVGQYRAGAALLNALPAGVPAPEITYETDVRVGKIDTNIFLGTFVNERPVALRFAYTAPSITSAGGNPTEVTANQERYELALQYFPSSRTMISFGVFGEAAEVREENGGASIDIDGRGVRFDVLHRFNDQWGAALRAEVFDGDQSTRIPVGPATLEYELPETRTYIQANLIGHYTSDDLAALPTGWALKPELGLIWQRSNFDPVQNSFGGTSTGTVGDQEEISLAQLGLRFEDIDLEPWGIDPFGSVMVEQELINDFSDVIDDPTTASAVIGARIGLGQAAFINAQAMHSQSIGGNRQSTSFLIYLGAAF